MIMMRFLILTTFFLGTAAEASMRHALRLFEHPTRLSRFFSNTIEVVGDRYVIYNDFTHSKLGNMINVQCPKDWGSFREITGFCKPKTIPIEQNGKIIQKLTYKRGCDFSDADVDSAVRPDIPDLPEIRTPKDILRVAKFYQKYANFMTKHFLQTQNVLGEYVNEHRIALLSEPETLLNLVRPGEPIQVRERVAIRAKNALKNTRDVENALILAFCDYDLNLAFSDFETYIDWENWYPKNKDLIDAILCFGKAIYKDTSDIEAYQTEEEFNAALIEVDPEFTPLIAGK